MQNLGFADNNSVIVIADEIFGAYVHDRWFWSDTREGVDELVEMYEIENLNDEDPILPYEVVRLA